MFVFEGSKSGKFNFGLKGGIILLFTFLPLLVALIYLKMINVDFSIFKSYPYYSDEWAYWKQIQAVVLQGNPWGYWGYNGTHASVGGLGSHGIVLLLPYVLFGKIFGWGIHSSIYCNICFLCIANLLFVLFTRCNFPSLVKLSLVQFLLYIKFQYSITGMTESLKYALAIILVGMFYRIWLNKNSKWWFKYIIVPAVLLFSIQCYLILAVFVPVYIISIMTYAGRYKMHTVYAITVCGTFGISALSYWLWHLAAAPVYGDSIGDIFVQMGKGDFKGIILEIQRSLKEFLGFILHEPFFRGYLTVYIIVGLLSLIVLITYHKTMEQKDSFLHGCICFVLAAFLAGYIIFYGKTNYWSITRGINTALVAGTYLLCLGERRVEMKCYIVYIILSAYFFHLNYQAWISVINMERFITQEVKEEIKLLSDNFDGKLQIKEKKLSWDNTISVISAGSLDSQLWPFAISPEFGINVILYKENPEIYSGYILVIGGGGKDVIKSIFPDTYEERIIKNYSVLYEDGNYLLLERY